jgi:hypothetical protein
MLLLQVHQLFKDRKEKDRHLQWGNGTANDERDR